MITTFVALRMPEGRSRGHVACARPAGTVTPPAYGSNMHSNTDAVRERPLSQLALEITSGAVRLAAATAAWLRLVAEFDRREGWHTVGVLSSAHWLAWQCGMSPGAAREHVRVARALTTLPRLTTAFTEGRLSYSKVRALTRVAEPDTEESLLEFALAATASQTERLVRQWRRADAPDAATLSLKRQFEYWWDDDGMLVLRVRLEPDQGAHLLTAIDSLAERAARRDRAEARRRATADTPVTVGTAGDVPTGDVPTGDGADEDDQVALARERTTARRCTALVQLAEAAVDLDRCPGDPPRREVVVHVDAAVLADDTAAGRAHIEGGPSLHPSQVRRMLCGASVVSMLERGREVLAVGRARRLATRAQRRALIRRDGGLRRAGLSRGTDRAFARRPHAALDPRRTDRPVEPGAAVRRRPRTGSRSRPDHDPPRRSVDRDGAGRLPGLGSLRRGLRHGPRQARLGRRVLRRAPHRPAGRPPPGHGTHRRAGTGDPGAGPTASKRQS